MTTTTTAARTTRAEADADLVYVNGINFDTGTYAVKPAKIADLARSVRRDPEVGPVRDLQRERRRTFGLPLGVEPEKLETTGWGIVFHVDTPRDVREALAPLTAARRDKAQRRYHELDYRRGEQTRDWYRRHQVAPGNLNPRIVPYYLLLAGPPSLIPFEFQYLLGIEYAVGRLDFATPAEYERYARSILAYESGSSVPNTKEIVYWGTRHQGDPATDMSASLLVSPLANGIPGVNSALAEPVVADVAPHYDQKLFLGKEATKEALLSTFHAGRPPAFLFTASHGLQVDSDRPNQMTGQDQGALVCQDFPFPSRVRPEHYLAATDVKDNANVNGLVAMVFACYGAGTPHTDQFLENLGQDGEAPPLAPPRAPQPFSAALPRRLLAHPNGAALAVIGHVDRAFGYSIQQSRAEGPQIETFRNSIGFILKGAPVGHVMAQYFGARFADLSTHLLSVTSPSAPSDDARPNDRELVDTWLERNDAQNYVMLGDPWAQIRKDALV
jgi:hypothetical protein